MTEGMILIESIFKKTALLLMQFLIRHFIWYNASNAAARVGSVAISPGNQMNMGVHDGLSVRSAAICPDIKTSDGRVGLCH
jgi:hypothetical protein